MLNFFKKRKYSRNENIKDINYIELKERSKTGAILLDVRSPQEYKEGHLEGAILVPVYELDKNIEKIINDKNAEIILYCQSGNRSQKAYKVMQSKGYNNLYNLKGGIDDI